MVVLHSFTWSEIPTEAEKSRLDSSIDRVADCHENGNNGQAKINREFSS